MSLNNEQCKTRPGFINLNQGEYIFLNHTSSEVVFKTSLRYLYQDQYIRLGHTSSRRLAKTSSKRVQDVFKTSCRNVFKISSRRLQDVFRRSSRRLTKTSSRHIAKTSSKHLQDIFKKSCKNIFKTFLIRIIKLLFLLKPFQDVFETYLKRFWDVLQRQLSTEGFV